MATHKHKGVSLAKGPVAIIGMALLAYGVTALIFGGQSLSADPLNGTVNGDTWLGLEVNGWSSLLFVGAGALLLFGSPLHWAAKTMSLIVGVGLAAAAVIALIDQQDVLGIFAANGLTMLVWGAAGALLILLALLPRVGSTKRKHASPQRSERPERSRRESARFGREDPESDSRRNGEVGSPPETQETTRRR